MLFTSRGNMPLVLLVSRCMTLFCSNFHPRSSVSSIYPPIWQEWQVNFSTLSNSKLFRTFRIRILSSFASSKCPDKRTFLLPRCKIEAATPICHFLPRNQTWHSRRFEHVCFSRCSTPRFSFFISFLCKIFICPLYLSLMLNSSISILLPYVLFLFLQRQ